MSSKFQKSKCVEFRARDGLKASPVRPEEEREFSADRKRKPTPGGGQGQGERKQQTHVLVLETADEGGNSGLIAGPCCSGTDKATSALLGTLHVPRGNTRAEVKNDLGRYRAQWTCGCLMEPRALMRKYSQAIQEIQWG